MNVKHINSNFSKLESDEISIVNNNDGTEMRFGTIKPFTFEIDTFVVYLKLIEACYYRIDTHQLRQI